MLDTPENRVRFAEAISAGYLTVGQPAPNKAMLRMYWDTLSGYTLEDVESAVRKHLANPDQGQFAPKPADLIRLIDGDTNTRAALAWGKVENAIRSVGQYESVVFDDGLIHAVLCDMGGWTKVCAVTLDELPFMARDFSARYRANLSKPPATYPRSLAGLVEMDRTQKGLDPLPPTVIGDREQARLVWRSGGKGGTLQLSRGTSVTELLGIAVRQLESPKQESHE